MKYYVAEVSGNYADEFDISSHAIIDEQEKNVLGMRVLVTGKREVYFGTNEALDLGTIDIEVQEISEADIEIIEKYNLTNNQPLTVERVIEVIADELIYQIGNNAPRIATVKMMNKDISDTEPIYSVIDVTGHTCTISDIENLYSKNSNYNYIVETLYEKTESQDENEYFEQLSEIDFANRDFEYTYTEKLEATN